MVWNGSASGVDLDRFDIIKKAAWRNEYRAKVWLEEKHLVIGFAGSVRRDKGCNELITAYQNFFSDMPKARLMLVGDKCFYDTIDESLRNWVTSFSQVIHILPNSKIPQYMACMDIFSLPSYREGFGLVIIEAEAMGVPVVVSDVPGPIDAADCLIHTKRYIKKSVSRFQLYLLYIFLVIIKVYQKVML